MSHEINKSIELSEQELDVVAGGASLNELTAFAASQESIKSASAATAFGSFSTTDIQSLDVESVVQKQAEA
ncbi:CTB family bacteriocin [Fischerella sp. JS2]|uniref:CTB family bacteriocin n=1 Tax=Fischerella sp. JS2 TaxID=2597771 RepID=UPI0028ED9AE4|nr:CTB family bacteriocin [Fischerella sp. JS2]